MRRIAALIGIVALAGCATMGAPGSAVRQIGTNLYSVSEMHVMGGNVAQHAAAYCASLGQEMQIEGTTAQRGAYSGTEYSVMVFRCQ